MPLTVQAVRADDYGGLIIELSENHRLQVISSLNRRERALFSFLLRALLQGIPLIPSLMSARFFNWRSASSFCRISSTILSSNVYRFMYAPRALYIPGIHFRLGSLLGSLCRRGFWLGIEPTVRTEMNTNRVTNTKSSKISIFFFLWNVGSTRPPVLSRCENAIGSNKSNGRLAGHPRISPAYRSGPTPKASSSRKDAWREKSPQQVSRKPIFSSTTQR